MKKNFFFFLPDAELKQIDLYQPLNSFFKEGMPTVCYQTQAKFPFLNSVQGL